AALIHLCGAGAAERYASRGLRLAPGQRCGDHSAKGYIARVNLLRRVFAALAARSQSVDRSYGGFARRNRPSSGPMGNGNVPRSQETLFGDPIAIYTLFFTEMRVHLSNCEPMDSSSR